MHRASTHFLAMMFMLVVSFANAGVNGGQWGVTGGSMGGQWGHFGLALR